jgi:hypothetical protein
MTGTDHEHSESVITAAQWLADERAPPQPIIPELRRRFGLNSLEACEASAMAQRFRICRKAFG